MTTEHDLEEGRVYPPLHMIREISTKLATKIVEYAYKSDLAEAYPEPADKEAFVLDHQYSADYESFIPITYPWPGMNE